MKSWWKENGDLAAIVLIAFVVRLSLVGLLHQQGYTSDEKEYLSLAAKLAAGGSFVDSNGEWATKAPLWPATLSLVFRWFGSGLALPHIVTCGLGALAVFLGFRLCLALTGERFTALGAASLMTFYPGLVIYSDVLQTEALYIVFVLLTFVYAERVRERPSVGNGVLLGLWAAAATLTRAVFVGFFVVLVLVVVWLHRERIREYGKAIAVAAAIWLVVLTPWTVRNYSVLGTFVPVSSWGGMSLLLGNNPYSTGTWSSKSGFDQWFAAQAADHGVDLANAGEAEKSSIARVLGLEFVRSHPGDALRLSVKKFYMHWVYPITNSDSNIPLQAVAVASDVGIYLLAGIGFLAGGARRRRMIPIGAAVVFFTLLQTVLHCEARYRLPIMPFVIFMSASGVAVLADTRKMKMFFHIGRNLTRAIAWVAVITAVYTFTAWQFLTGRI